MSEKKGPFDELIEMLRGLVWANQLQCNQAANVLEAAGRVDKKACLRFLERVNEDDEIRDYLGLKILPLSEVRALLESLPEKP